MEKQKREKIILLILLPIFFAPMPQPIPVPLYWPEIGVVSGGTRSDTEEHPPY